jgi:adenosylcobyric acid synthase
VEPKPKRSRRTAPCLAILGTGSEVGKSIVTTALCRIFANQGMRVAPFKSQNMSNNSGVTPDGLEMGRAQIVQAEAARLPPHVNMNPILLKPTSDVGSQVVLLGKALENRSAAEYHERKEDLFLTASSALDRIRERHELILMEGAGSCAEVNLMAHDIVNFRMAEYADAPVVLVADIHRGGVFAQIVGTLECLPEKQRDRIIGFVINRFRGDIALFEDGVRWIEERTGKPVFGVIPWYSTIRIEAEDSVVIERPGTAAPPKPGTPAIAVIRLPHIANFTDFDPLFGIEGLSVHFIETPQDLSAFKALILPGSKNTRHDLGWLRESGWTERIEAFVASGGHTLGICGGYQMMGRTVQDPEGLESIPGTSEGLGLLPVDTVLMAPKTTTLTRFTWNKARGTGYEIHMGQTQRLEGTPLFNIQERNRTACRSEDGCVGPDARCLGTYIHGLFDTPGITRRWLECIGLPEIKVSRTQGLAARDREYDKLAEHFTAHLDMERLMPHIQPRLRRDDGETGS